MDSVFSRVETTIPNGKPFLSLALPFAHAAAFLPAPLSTEKMDLTSLVEQVTRVYRSTLIEAFKSAGLDYNPFTFPRDSTADIPNPLPPSYNFILTTQWMLIVPRKADAWNGIGANSVAYAGLVFVKSQEQFDEIRTKGLFEFLKELTYPAQPVTGALSV